MPVTVGQILAAPTKYQGQRVAVLGVFWYEFEDVAIQSDDSPDPLWVHCHPTSTPVEGFVLRKGVVKTAIVEGVVRVGPSGHFNLFAGEITQVTRIVSAKRWREQPGTRSQ